MVTKPVLGTGIEGKLVVGVVLVVLIVEVGDGVITGGFVIVGVPPGVH